MDNIETKIMQELKESSLSQMSRSANIPIRGLAVRQILPYSRQALKKPEKRFFSLKKTALI